MSSGGFGHDGTLRFNHGRHLGYTALAEGAPEGGLPLANLLRDLGLEKSTSDARRNIEQGGVKVDGEVVRDPKTVVRAPASEMLIQVGKRRFARVRGA